MSKTSRKSEIRAAIKKSSTRLKLGRTPTYLDATSSGGDEITKTELLEIAAYWEYPVFEVQCNPGYYDILVVYVVAEYENAALAEALDWFAHKYYDGDQDMVIEEGVGPAAIREIWSP